MRRVTHGVAVATAALCAHGHALVSSRCSVVDVPWTTALPQAPQGFEALGRSLVEHAVSLDTGPLAFGECFVAREQLETIVRSCGYDISVFAFGGLSVLGLLEVGGDVDFVGILDVEPNVEEASAIIGRLAREMRRLGLRATALPRARVPVAKVQRVSRDPPGTQPHALASTGVFQLVQPLAQEQEAALAARLHALQAESIEWSPTRQSVTATFPTSSALVEAIAKVKKQGTVEIPLRLPVETRHGPELYRYPFDLCLSSTGLRNSTLLAESLAQYPYARHLLLALKRWGKSSGIVHTLDGLLASYALTVLCVHFLTQLDVIPLVETNRLSDEPHLMPKQLVHRPLKDIGTAAEMETLGRLFTLFFEYYGTIFDFEHRVVCTTHKVVQKSVLRWDTTAGDELGRPPYFHVAIKDPYGLDNVGRNITQPGAKYVKQAFAKGHAYCCEAVQRATSADAAKDALETLVENPPMPPKLQEGRHVRRDLPPGLSPEEVAAVASHDKTAMRLKQLAFDKRRTAVNTFGKETVNRTTQHRAATGVAHSMVSWLRSDNETDVGGRGGKE